MSSELSNTLLLLGAAQGLFLAVLLLTKRTNATANRILALAMLAFSLYIFSGVYYARQYYYDFPHLIGVSVPLVYLFGPILYLYARTVSAGSHAFRKGWLLHLLPCLLLTLYLVPFYLESGTAKVAYLETLARQGPPVDLAVIEQLQYPYGILYVVLTIGLLRHHRARLTDDFSALEEINLLWLRNLTVGITAVWALATGLHLLDLAGVGIGALESNVTQLAVALLVYAIGYLGLRQPEIFHGPADPGIPAAPVAAQADQGRVPAAGAPLAEPVAAAGDGAGYQKSGLTPEEAEALMTRLREVMEAKRPYLKSQLTLQELAGEMAISPHNLSEIINTCAEMNFYDFVNGYRVEEVMRRLRDPRSANLTILALAAESGFNSKATFNAFFKRHTGQTPSQYRSGQGAGE